MRRRQFLATSALLGSTSPEFLAHPSPHPPRLSQGQKTDYRVAVIGMGWYGKMDLFRLLQVAEVEVVGLCDVDRKQLEHAAEWLKRRHPEQQPRLYGKHEELLDKEKPDIVLIETPDHWHAIQAVDCLEAGAHLYLQKPISRTIEEAERILEAARRSDRTIQVALQRRSTPHLVHMKENYLDNGKIGPVHHVEMCCYYHMRDNAVREKQDVPDYFDYERYTGPTEKLPFRGIPHRRWRSFMAYSNGIMGDMCVHWLDAVRWLLGLGAPADINSQGGIYVNTEADATITDTQTAQFNYPDRKLNLHWTHRSWGAAPNPDWPWSFTLYGDNGTLQASTLGYEWRPGQGKDERDFVKVGATYEREQYPEDVGEEDIELHVASATRAHFRDFLAAIESGEPPVANIEEAYISTVACIRANELLGQA